MDREEVMGERRDKKEAGPARPYVTSDLGVFWDHSKNEKNDVFTIYYR